MCVVLVGRGKPEWVHRWSVSDGGMRLSVGVKGVGKSVSVSEWGHWGMAIRWEKQFSSATRVGNLTHWPTHRGAGPTARPQQAGVVGSFLARSESPHITSVLHQSSSFLDVTLSASTQAASPSRPSTDSDSPPLAKQYTQVVRRAPNGTCGRSRGGNGAPCRGCPPASRPPSSQPCGAAT